MVPSEKPSSYTATNQLVWVEFAPSENPVETSLPVPISWYEVRWCQLGNQVPTHLVPTDCKYYLERRVKNSSVSLRVAYEGLRGASRHLRRALRRFAPPNRHPTRRRPPDPRTAYQLPPAHPAHSAHWGKKQYLGLVIIRSHK